MWPHAADEETPFGRAQAPSTTLELLLSVVSKVEKQVFEEASLSYKSVVWKALLHVYLRSSPNKYVNSYLQALQNSEFMLRLSTKPHAFMFIKNLHFKYEYYWALVCINLNGSEFFILLFLANKQINEII